MWPKMLLELLPHVTRLVPLADKFLSTRSASEKAQEAALAALSLEVRSELVRGAEKHSNVLRLLQEQSVQLGDVALGGTRTQMAVEGLEQKVAKLEAATAAAEARSALALKLLGIVLAFIIVGTVLLVAILVRTAR